MKSSITFIVSMILIILIIPPLAVLFIPADASFAVFILTLFIVNPIISIFLGIHAGYDVKHMWFVPILPSAAFLLTSPFAFGDFSAMLMYSCAYLVIGAAAMVICVTAQRISKKRKNRGKVTYEA